MKQLTLEGTERSPAEFAATLSERERIDFIKQHGNEIQQKGMESILKDGCDYKIDHEHQWENQFQRGKKLVQKILERDDIDV